MLKIGEKIDDYEIFEFLGQGAGGSVYKSRHPLLEHEVAIKILGLSAKGTNDRHLNRFRREAQLAGKLAHPCIAKPLSFGVAPEGAYIIYEYVPGKSLAAELASGRQYSNDEIVPLMVQLFSALKIAHDNEIIHRDVKPSNIMITTGNALKLLDFGAGMWLESSNDQRLTATAEFIGTAAYMSPEQCSGRTLDGRTDLYSAGCVLYELLAGAPPFLGCSSMELMLMHANAEPQRIAANRKFATDY